MSPENVGIAYENIYFETKDGGKVHGWYIPSDSSEGTVLFCHGNGGNISHRMESIRIFNELCLNVFIFDYRGYGNSAGSPGETGTYEDAAAALAYLTDVKGKNPDEIIVFGRSLGGAIATNVAANFPVGGLIIESAFTSIKDLGAGIYPFLPVGLLSRFDYNTLETIKKVKCPKLIIHSRDDDLVPFTHGRYIYDAATAPKEFLELSGGHNEGYLVDEHAYKTGINLFVRHIIKGI